MDTSSRLQRRIKTILNQIQKGKQQTNGEEQIAEVRESILLTDALAKQLRVLMVIMDALIAFVAVEGMLRSDDEAVIAEPIAHLIYLMQLSTFDNVQNNANQISISISD